MKIQKLECLRGFAAVYVMLGHLCSNSLGLKHQWVGQPFRFAQEGVLLFFLLSGFVIYYSWHTVTGTKTFQIFFYKRFKRIYPIYVLSLLVAYLAMSLGKGLQPIHLSTILGNLFMTQSLSNDPGWRSEPFMDNDPLWSLSYEWWFYMMFYPIYRFVPPSRQKLLVFALAVTGIIGCQYVDTGTFTWRRQQGIISILIFTTLAQALVVWDWVHHGGHLTAFGFPLIKLRYSAVTVVLVALFFLWRRTGFKGFDYTLGPFGIFAGISYALYVLHFPIICNMDLITTPSLLYLNVILKIALVLTLAYLAEEVLQKRLNRWLDSGARRYFPSFLGRTPGKREAPLPAS